MSQIEYPSHLLSLPDNRASIPLAKRKIIFSIVKKYRLDKCLEAGFSHGVSSVVIGSATPGTLLTFDRLHVHHYEPNIENLLAQFNLTNVKPIYCEDYIWEFGKLAEMGERFNFIFIDASHMFTETVAGIALADRLLTKKGFLILDDLPWVPSVSLPLNLAQMQQKDRSIGVEQFASASVKKAFQLFLQNNHRYRCVEKERMAICYKRW